MKQIEPKTFELKVDGISKEQLDVHMTLYQGYVTNFNGLMQDRENYLKNPADSRAFSDLTRRIAFEYDGIRLHELYFNNLKSGAEAGAKFQNAAISSFGSFEEWKADFSKVLTIRGIGWGIVFFDKENNQLINTFVADHEIGHLATLNPVLVIDLWEHAFSVDFKPTEKAKYLEVIWKNIGWDAVEERM